ncbi:MAG: tetratricopeptide repeat protein, partial [Myxococcales bacterium]|nr:tetratricopeptide repeat protein [Myxococcales bacterium]
AAAVYTAALADDPAAVGPAIALAQLRVRAGASDPLAAIVRAQALLGADPRAAVRPGLRALALAHADLLVETGRKDQAIAVLDAALADDPDDNSAQLRRGVLALEQGRGAAGRADLAAVFERTGGYPGLVGPLGRLYLRDGDLAGLAELVQPHAADPDAPDDVVLMNALLRLAQGDRDAADSNVEKVLQRSPGSWEAHLVKARVLYERDRNADAAAEIRLARPRSPDAEVELWTGKIAERSGKTQDAVTAYRRARQQDPGLLEAGFLLGRALLAQGLAREAVAELQAVTRAAEVPPGAHLALGLALREREQLPEALQSFTHAIDHDPNPDEALYWAGRTAAELGRHAEAVPRLGRAVALAGAGTSWQADAQLWLGRSLHRLGRRPEARAAFAAYLQLAGDRAAARGEVEKLLRER